MLIGEFAEICGTKISVLRHYDKEGVLVPDYIDNFTGYRHYSTEQKEVFIRVSALKKAGFSLSEIKEILLKVDNQNAVLNLINQKKKELEESVKSLEQAKEMIVEISNSIQTFIEETENGIIIKTSLIDTMSHPEKFFEACLLLKEMATKYGYQRISNFCSYGKPLQKEIEVRIDVIKLSSEVADLKENIDIPFENDDAVIGKWEVIGEYAVKDDFFAKSFNEESSYGNENKEIYFLPHGERYWGYGWTKGFLICDFGEVKSLNQYEIEEHYNERYMFVQNKSYYYRKGGKPTILVLHQLDNIRYTRFSIARKDNINMPFVDDRKVLGKWKSICYCREKIEFDAKNINNQMQLYFESIEFKENGRCESIYQDNIINEQEMQVWTKGYVLRKYNNTACKYEIFHENGVEYLIMEWKSGDYIWGGFDTDYYVFERV